MAASDAGFNSLVDLASGQTSAGSFAKRSAIFWQTAAGCVFCSFAREKLTEYVTDKSLEVHDDQKSIWQFCFCYELLFAHAVACCAPLMDFSGFLS
jgi:hypothetical protein